MIRINLLPVRAAQKKEKVRSQMSILVLSLLAVTIACGAEYFRMTSTIDSKKEEISSVQDQINKLRRQIGEVSKYKKLQADLKKKLDILKTLKDGRSGPVHLLDQLNISLPDKLWLTAYAVSGGKVSIDGMAVDEKVVATFMEKLEASPYYTGVELNGISLSMKNKMKLQKFKLTCQVARPAK